MKNFNKKTKYASATVALLILYFHIMEISGYGHNIELRAFNGVILFTSIFMYLKRKDVSSNNYISKILGGFSLGLMINIIFTIYISTYILVINPSFYKEMITMEALGNHIPKMLIPVVIFIESSASAFLFSYISMQYLKKEKTIIYKHSNSLSNASH